MPYAFTEQGVAMLSSVLKSKAAIEMNIAIMRAFVAMRHALMSSAGVLQRLGTVEVKLIETDKRLDTVFDALDRGRRVSTYSTRDAKEIKKLLSQLP